MSEWKTYKLGDLIDVKHGFAFKGEFFSDEPTEDILLTPGNFKIGGGFKTDKFKYYKGDYPKSYVLKEGDILITMTDLSKAGDTLGYSAKIPKHTGINYLHNQRLGLVQFKSDNIDPDFLYWVLRTKPYQYYIVGSATGSTVKHTSPTRICSYEFQAPKDKGEQQQIAQILSSLDDKIELNLQMNQTLEAMAQAIFKEWFVNFNFPGFDGELVDGLPKGWRRVQLTDLLNTISVTHKFPKGEAIFLNTSDISDGKFLHRNFSSKESLPGQAKKTIQKGDILFTEIRPANRRYAFVDFDADDYVVSTKLMVLRSKGLIDNLVIYYFMKSDEVLHQLQSLAESRSGTFPQITYDELAKVIMPLPDLNTQMCYTDFLWSVFDKVRENEKQIEYLTQTRDTLLPKLMSGQLEIGN